MRMLVILTCWRALERLHMIKQALLVLLVDSSCLVHTINYLLLLQQRASRTKALHQLLIVVLLEDGAVIVHARCSVEHMCNLLDTFLLAAEWH